MLRLDTVLETMGPSGVIVLPHPERQSQRAHCTVCSSGMPHSRRASSDDHHRQEAVDQPNAPAPRRTRRRMQRLQHGIIKRATKLAILINRDALVELEHRAPNFLTTADEEVIRNLYPDYPDPLASVLLSWRRARQGQVRVGPPHTDLGRRVSAIFDKAAVVVKNHPLVDNKRLGLTSARQRPHEEPVLFLPPRDEAIEFAVRIAEGSPTPSEIASWLRRSSALLEGAEYEQRRTDGLCSPPSSPYRLHTKRGATARTGHQPSRYLSPSARSSSRHGSPHCSASSSDHSDDEPEGRRRSPSSPPYTSTKTPSPESDTFAAIARHGSPAAQPTTARAFPSVRAECGLDPRDLIRRLQRLEHARDGEVAVGPRLHVYLDILHARSLPVRPHASAFGPHPMRRVRTQPTQARSPAPARTPCATARQRPRRGACEVPPGAPLQAAARSRRRKHLRTALHPRLSHR